MAYRDELGAAQERVALLEAELEEAREKIASLEARPLAEPRADPEASAPAPAPSPPRRAGGICYHPPPTYWPMLHLWRVSAQVAIARRPSIKPLASDRVIVWLFHYCVKIPFI